MPPINSDIFGQVIGLADIEQAYIAQLMLWMPTYAASIERAAGLAIQTIPLPPDPILSYKGAIDWETWTIGMEPVVMVKVVPYETPERFGDTSYSQWMECQVAVVVQEDDEDTARIMAQYYGAIIMSLISQHGGMGGLVSKTILTGYPTVQFVNVEALGRRVCRTVVTFHSAVDGVVTEFAGPSLPAANPYAPPGGYPEVLGPPTVTFDFVEDGEDV